MIFLCLAAFRCSVAEDGCAGERCGPPGSLCSHWMVLHPYLFNPILGTNNGQEPECCGHDRKASVASMPGVQVLRCSALCYINILSFCLESSMKENCGQPGATPLTCPIAVMQYFAGFGSLIGDVPNNYRPEVKRIPPMGGTAWRTRGCRGARSLRCSWTECAKTTSQARKAWPRHRHPWG